VNLIHYEGINAGKFEFQKDGLRDKKTVPEIHSETVYKKNKTS